ncbi:MAG TPA: hypothetical protein VJ810_17880 [Blastocatellia bacterium]|nr:hypothetical protein [Blastocatellia bacterium]
MFKRSFQVLAVSALVLYALTAGASAQSLVAAKKVKVDFDFYAGKKLMPAGEYEFTLTPNHQTHKLVHIRRTDGDANAIVTSVPGSNLKGLQPGAIVFNKYGDQYYLARVTLGDSGYVHNVVKSKGERKLLRAVAANVNANQVIVPTTGQ